MGLCRSTSVENLRPFESRYFLCQMEEAAPDFFNVPFVVGDGPVVKSI